MHMTVYDTSARDLGRVIRIHMTAYDNKKKRNVSMVSTDEGFVSKASGMGSGFAV